MPVNKRYFVRIYYPFEEGLTVHSESETDSWDYAKRAFKRWCDDVRQSNLTAVVSLVEWREKVHKTTVIAPDQEIEVNEGADFIETLKQSLVNSGAE